MSEDEIIFDLVGREFDTEFYAAEYPALGLSAVESLAHFCRIGWFEGRCPNPYFDTVSYLMRYPDIVASRRNPYFHYLFHGREEGRRDVHATRGPPPRRRGGRGSRGRVARFAQLGEHAVAVA